MHRRLLSVKEVAPLQLIKATAQYLKENELVKPPSWAPFVKTGVSKDRPPTDPDWWYVRCAAILRKVYLKGPIGVSRLRKMYGGRHRVGHGHPRFAPGSGSIIRKALQQLEAAGLLVKDKKGRSISEKGRKLLEEISSSLAKKQAKQSE